MRLVIDTGVLYRPEALDELRRAEAPTVLPAIVFGERARQLGIKGRPLDELRRVISEARFLVEPFGEREAARLHSRPPADAVWREHARDAMIAAHVRDADILWTTNPRDFIAIGLRPEQVRGV